MLWQVRTLAGMGVALLCGPPGQVIEEVIAALAVHAGSIVLTVTPRIHLQDRKAPQNFLKRSGGIESTTSMFREEQAESVHFLPHVSCVRTCTLS